MSGDSEHFKRALKRAGVKLYDKKAIARNAASNRRFARRNRMPPERNLAIGLAAVQTAMVGKKAVAKAEKQRKKRSARRHKSA